MDPRSNSNSGLGLPQSDGDMGQAPLTHTPQSFHAPDTGASHFDASGGGLPQISTPAQPAPMAPQPSVAPPPIAAQSSDQQRAQYANPMPTTVQAMPSDDTDTAFDEEWVGKAREVIQRTHADPYLQSQQLSKLKAQYIKLRYNKDVKVSEE